MELINEHKIGIVKGTVMKEEINGLHERNFK